MRVATAAAVDATNWKNREVDWVGFGYLLGLDRPAGHRECGGVLGGWLAEGGHKTRENVAGRSVVSLDIDKAEDLQAVLGTLTALGVSFYWHTTWRHTPEEPRVRAWVQVDRDMSPAEYERVVWALMAEVGLQRCDTKSALPEQMMWKPSTQDPATYQWGEVAGGALAVEDWASREVERPRRTAVEPLEPVGDGEPPQAVLNRAKAILASSLRKVQALDGYEGRNEAVYKQGWLLMSLVAGGVLDEGEVREGLWEAACRADRGRNGDAWSEAEHTACLRRAEADAEPGWPTVVGPEQEFDRVSVPSGPVTVAVTKNPAPARDWLRLELGRAGRPLEGFFQRGRGLIHVPSLGQEFAADGIGYAKLTPHEGDDDGPMQVRPVNLDQLTAEVEARYRVVRDGDVAMFPPAAAKSVYNALDHSPNLRLLRGISHTPFLRRDGTVCSVPGYDEPSQKAYLPLPGLAVRAVPDRPGEGEVAEARDLVLKVLSGFPFETEHDRANYVCAMFTPMLREIVPGPYRMVLINAPVRSSGKGYLANTLRILHGGVLRADLPGNSEELRKQLTGIFLTDTAPVIQWDNVTYLSSNVLDALLTTDSWSDRPLSKSESVTVKNDRLQVATGNNVVLGGDLMRRVLWVSLDHGRHGVERPELLTGFWTDDHPGGYLGWVKDHKGDLLWALLTLARAWVAAGRPQGEKVGATDFTEWMASVQGILAVAGIGGTIGHADTVQQEESAEEAEWGAFLEAIHAEFGESAWPARALQGHEGVTDAAPAGLNVFDAREVGKWLRNRRKRFVGGFRVVEAGEDAHAKTKLWRVERSVL